jgi:7-cyano-7-deazaguanine synthase
MVKEMTNHPTPTTVGILASGGLDSSILLAHLLETGRRVQPLYIWFGLAWQDAELKALRRFLAALDCVNLLPLAVLEMPVIDLYGDHWSINGRGVPGAATPDEAVYLPGRNALLLVKATLWCHTRKIDELAMAPLASNPFPDATPEFFADLEAVLNRGMAGRVHLVRPFANLSKQQVMQLGCKYPLELTFCCIDPRGERHCGVCNKCAERRAAFHLIGAEDPTEYAERVQGSGFRVQARASGCDGNHWNLNIPIPNPHSLPAVPRTLNPEP